MEQVILYLEIMKVRFPNIRLETELGSENFYLPPMTIQLLTENAILHGICKRRRSEGTVRITSAKLAHGYRVTVEDNGVGFSGELPADGKKHIGIANVSRRLETLCGGSLVIRSLPGEGTLCIIRVPESCGTDWRGERRADRFNAEV
jgi:sensor histidine kinase YesM